MSYKDTQKSNAFASIKMLVWKRYGGGKNKAKADLISFLHPSGVYVCEQCESIHPVNNDPNHRHQCKYCHHEQSLLKGSPFFNTSLKLIEHIKLTLLFETDIPIPQIARQLKLHDKTVRRHFDKHLVYRNNLDGFIASFQLNIQKSMRRGFSKIYKKMQTSKKLKERLERIANSDTPHFKRQWSEQDKRFIGIGHSDYDKREYEKQKHLEIELQGITTEKTSGIKSNDAKKKQKKKSKN